MQNDPGTLGCSKIGRLSLPQHKDTAFSDLEVSGTGDIVDRVLMSLMSVRSVSKLHTSVTDVSHDISGMRDL